MSAACCLLASAEAALRARPAAAFAALSHMLISRFFFNQGFAIDLVPSMGRDWHSMPRTTSHDIAVHHERPALPFVPRGIHLAHLPADCCRFAASPGKAPRVTIAPRESLCCSATMEAVQH